MKQWYFIHTYSGHENKVVESLAARVRDMELGELITSVLLPKKPVLDVRGGKEHVSEVLMYPGYVLVEIDCDDKGKIPDNVFHAIRATPKVTGFLGGKNPTPLSHEEVDQIIRHMEEAAEKPKPKFTYEVGEVVRIKSGPFASFTGKVEEVNEDKTTLKVSITIFGRSTPYELNFLEVEKVTFTEDE